jgi:DNA-binding transcriptional LysR family regulator
MNLRGIQYVLAVASARNFSQAARTLHIAQPAITTQIKLLEEELGFSLFNRSTRRVSLTAEGDFLIPKLKSWMAQLSAMIDETKDLHHDYTAHLSIGFLASATSAFLPRILKTFCASYPNIRIRLVEGNPEDHRRLLELDELDLAFTRSLKMSKSFKTHCLLRDKLILAVPKGEKNPLKQAPKQGRGQQQIYLISNEVAPETHLASLRQIAKLGLESERILKVKDYHSAIIAVEAGLGFAILPGCIKAQYQSRVSFFSPDHAETIDLDLVYKPDAKKQIRDLVQIAKLELRDFAAQ